MLNRNYMFFTMDEVALIDGLIATYFAADSVSESVRVRYYETHQHLQDNRTDYVDLRNIKEALFFLAPLFHGSIQFEKDIWSVIAKTQRLLKRAALLQSKLQQGCFFLPIFLHSQSLEDFYPVRVVKRPSFSTFILKSS